MRVRKYFRILWRVLKHTQADKVLLSYVAFVFVCALLIWIFEPGITTYRAALWYCYAVISTAGFGDVVVTTFIPRLLSVLLTAYSLIAVAIITGVVVNFYIQVMENRNRDTIVNFLDQLERLPEMSEEELKDLSERVTEFRRSR